MEKQTDENKNENNNILRIVHMAALAISIPFEMAAGPFIGYLIGSFLMHRFGVPRAVMIVFVIMGLVGSFIDTAVIIKKIINKARESQ